MKYYTCEAIELPQEILEIPYAYTASCKNIYNASLCIIKNLANSYDKYVNNQEISYILKANLHQNTLDILNLAYDIVDKLNTKAISNNKEIKYHFYEPEISSNAYYQFLNANFISNLLKLKEFNSSYKDYTETPSHIASVAVEIAIQDYKTLYLLEWSDQCGFGIQFNENIDDYIKNKHPKTLEYLIDRVGIDRILNTTLPMIEAKVETIINEAYKAQRKEELTLLRPQLLFHEMQNDLPENNKGHKLVKL